MPLAGPRFFDGEQILEGSVQLDEQGRVVEVRQGEPGAPELGGLVVPAPVNAHTHIADRIARGHVEATSVEEVFAPPDGLKHRLLGQAGDVQLVAAMGRALDEASRAGMARVVDFREGGPDGARLARQAAGEADASQAGIQLTVLGRPSSPEAWEDEAEALAELVDGIGISGLNDQPMHVSRAQAAWCREHGKHLALHVSETKREDIEAALSLSPDLLVHATQATDEDIAAIAQAGVPVALCPRSNALFGHRPPVPELVEAGVVLGLGSDNAMFQSVEVWSEARLVLELFPELEPIHVLRMLAAFSLPGQPAAALAPETRACVLDDAKGLRHALTHARVTVL